MSYIYYTSHPQASIPTSRQFLRESLSIANATATITSDLSFDLITYGMIWFTLQPSENEKKVVVDLTKVLRLFK